ncbi:MAG: amidohydrolase family protein [Pseudomonadota bacterium]
MPDFSIVDSHLHIWDPSRLPYRWLNGHETLGRAYLLPDYDEAVDGVDVSKMVFVECDIDPGHALDEIAWVDEVALQDPRIAAYVAHAPVETGDAIAPLLERLQDFSKMRGVRRLIQGETQAGFCVQPKFIQGVQALERFGWSFDICILGWQMDDAISLVDACPNVQFILDHIGKPRIIDGALQPWARQMSALAERENVVCKLSGVATEADHQSWKASDLSPFIQTALQSFGPQRLMFGGDWPVATQAIDARSWISCVDDEVGSLSEDEKRCLFLDVAAETYRLD